MKFYCVEINGILCQSFSNKIEALKFINTLNKYDKIVMWLEEYPDDYHGDSEAHGYKTKIYQQN
jgi:hypothetical protein